MYEGVAGCHTWCLPLRLLSKRVIREGRSREKFIKSREGRERFKNSMKGREKFIKAGQHYNNVCVSPTSCT